MGRYRKHVDSKYRKVGLVLPPAIFDQYKKVKNKSALIAELLSNYFETEKRTNNEIKEN